MKYVVGVDIGGTFTDLVSVDETGDYIIVKTSSTPADPSIAVIDGLKKLATKYGKKDIKAYLSDVLRICHGTTVGTNTVLTWTGAKVGLLCTKGFRDILEIRVGGRKASGGGHGLIQRGVESFRFRPDEFRKGIHIGRFELCHRSVSQDLGRQGMQVRQLFEYINVRRKTRFRLLGRCQTELGEENFGELLRRVDVEFASGQFVNLPMVREAGFIAASKFFGYSGIGI